LVVVGGTVVAFVVAGTVVEALVVAGTVVVVALVVAGAVVGGFVVVFATTLNDTQEDLYEYRGVQLAPKTRIFTEYFPIA